MIRFLEFFVELIGFISIALRTALIGILVAWLTMAFVDGPAGMVIAIIIATAALIFGIVLAIKAWKGKGTVHFLSGHQSSSTLEEINKLRNSKDNTDTESIGKK